VTGSGTGPDTEVSGEEPTPPVDRLGLFFTLGAIALGAAAVLTIPALREAFGDAIGGNTEELRDEIRDLGAAGVAVLLGLILIHTFVWYPTEIINTAAGFVYGFWGALPIVMAGWVLQGIVAWEIGRRVARPLLERLLGRRRFDRAEEMVEEGGVPLLLAVRLIPIFPFSLFSFAMGAAHVSLWRFTWTTAVGYLPITAIFVYLGSRLDSLSVTDPLLLGGAAVLVVLLWLARPFFRGLRS
jgi:uncharacterized membrane protein YdjX (TVP38/TMEM64 family)